MCGRILLDSSSRLRPPRLYVNPISIINGTRPFISIQPCLGFNNDYIFKMVCADTSGPESRYTGSIQFLRSRHRQIYRTRYLPPQITAVPLIFCDGGLDFPILSRSSRIVIFLVKYLFNVVLRVRHPSLKRKVVKTTRDERKSSGPWNDMRGGGREVVTTRGRNERTPDRHV